MKWKRIKLGDSLEKSETVNPKKTPDSHFEYVDISSICNQKFLIEKTSTILGKDAPSRARRLIKTNDILFATVRPTLKRIAQVPEFLNGQVCSTGFFVLRPKALLLDARFLFYFLFTDSFMSEMEKRQKGASYPAVNDGDVKSQYIFLPPLEEQKQIVAILDEAFEGIDKAIENTEKNLANAREIFESYLNSIFINKGDDWVEKKFQEVCIKIKDGAHHSPKTLYSEKKENLFTYITSKNIRNNYMDLSKIQYVDHNFHNSIYPRCNPELGDILLTKDGVNTGNVTLNTLNEPFSLLSSVCLIKTDKLQILPAFLKYYIQSDHGFKQITGKMTGAAIRRIILRTIKSALVPFPPVNEQKNIVEKVDALLLETKRLETIYKRKIEALKELKQSILQKAFTGELTNPTVKKEAA